MAGQATQTLGSHRAAEWIRQVAIVVGASLFVAVCARITVPLPFTPVPLTLQNFAVLLVGLSLGWRRGFAAMIVYLLEGLSGMPVFNPTGPGGILQLLGPTGGFLLAYPFVAAVTGFVAERAALTFAQAAIAAFAGDMLLFAAGIGWLAILTHSLALAMRFGLYWFVFAEVIKIMAAAAIASGWRKARAKAV